LLLLRLRIVLGVFDLYFASIMFSNLASKVSNVFVWLFLFFNFVFGDVFIEPNPNEPME